MRILAVTFVGAQSPSGPSSVTSYSLAGSTRQESKAAFGCCRRRHVRHRLCHARRLDRLDARWQHVPALDVCDRARLVRYRRTSEAEIGHSARLEAVQTFDARYVLDRDDHGRRCWLADASRACSTYQAQGRIDGQRRTKSAGKESSRCRNGTRREAYLGQPEHASQVLPRIGCHHVCAWHRFRGSSIPLFLDAF